jgi:hypothetical protein
VAQVLAVKTKFVHGSSGDDDDDDDYVSQTSAAGAGVGGGLSSGGSVYGEDGRSGSRFGRFGSSLAKSDDDGGRGLSNVCFASGSSDDDDDD